jgi:hypothetical protein
MSSFILCTEEKAGVPSVHKKGALISHHESEAEKYLPKGAA